MTHQQPDGRFLVLDDAVRLFNASREEIREACQERRVRAVYLAENDENAIRVCLEDLREHFEETSEPEKANKLARWGKLVAKGTATVIGAKAVDMVTDGALEHAWEFLSGFIFRSLPAPSRSAPESTESAIAEETDLRPPTTVRDRAIRPGRDYRTRQGASTRAVTRQGDSGGRVTRQGGGGPTRSGGGDGSSRSGGGSGGGARRDGGMGGGFRTR